jgi:hypothetical protein
VARFTDHIDGNVAAHTVAAMSVGSGDRSRDGRDHR